MIRPGHYQGTAENLRAKELRVKEVGSQLAFYFHSGGPPHRWIAVCPFDSTPGRLAKLDRGQTADTAKHSREIGLIFEPDRCRDVADPHTRFL